MARCDLLVKDRTAMTRELYASQKTSLLEEPCWYFWAPNSQRLIASWTIADRGLLIDDVAINIVLDHVVGGIPPIVEDLRAEDMSTDAPDRIVTLLA